jgi:eukaryotic-like serine/threonine-protein kinase
MPSSTGSHRIVVNQGCIAYFDADPTTQKLTVASLGLAGYEVVPAATAEELAAVVESHADLVRAVVVDACKAPQTAGEVVRRLDGIGRELPIVVITTRDRPRPFEGAEGLPCLKRPFATPSLVRMIRHLLGDPSRSTVTPITPSSPSSDAAGSSWLREPSTRVGSYELLAEIARGGMGTVFLCRRAAQGGFERLYAMKVMHPHLARDEGFVAMLLDEARLASRIHHPNVASIVDVGHDDAGHYVVMEYIEGCTLAQLLSAAGKNRPPEMLIPLLVNVLEGLHAAHILEDDDGISLGLVHRDVSPQNVLIGFDGTARIADFGIAKARARMTSTAEGVRKGKLNYCSPEQLLDEDTLDARADVFSAGVVLWGMLTGERLFAASTEAAILRNVLEKPVLPPSTVGLQPPPLFDEVALRALERDPERRYQSALEMADALRNAAMSSGLWASPARIGAWVKQHVADKVHARRRDVSLARPRETADSMTPLLGPPSVTTARPVTLPGSTSPHPTRRRRILWMSVLALPVIAIGGMLMSDPTGVDSPGQNRDGERGEVSVVDEPVAPPSPAASPSSDAPEEPSTEADPSTEAEREDVVQVSESPRPAPEIDASEQPSAARESSRPTRPRPRKQHTPRRDDTSRRTDAPRASPSTATPNERPPLGIEANPYR